MECTICGGTLFGGHQNTHMDVIVTGDGLFHDNVPGGADAGIYDSSQPYGPFQCVCCGAEYEELDGSAPTSPPSDDWQNCRAGFQKTTDMMSQGPNPGRFQVWTGNDYLVGLRFQSCGRVHMDIFKKDNASNYLPDIYPKYNQLRDELPTCLFIQTTSYGVLDASEIVEFQKAMSTAIDASKAMMEAFITPLMEGRFKLGELIPEN